MPHGAWKRGHRAWRVLGQVGHPASWSGAGSQPDFLPGVHAGFSPLSAPHIILAAFSMMEELMGKGSTSFTYLRRDAFNLPACGLPSRMTSSPNGCEGARGAIFPADMTPCSGQGAGDAHSMQRQGIPRWSSYAQGTSSCTTLPCLLPWARHRGLAPGVKGFLFAFLES